MMEWIKAHKVWVIGGAVALFVLYLITRGSAGTSATSSAPGNDVSAATALQTAQLQASAQGQQISAASQAQSDQTAAQLELGKLQIAQAGAHDQLAAQVATSNINATQQLQSLLGSLSADVANTASNNDVAKTTVIATNQTQQQQIFADTVIAQSNNNAAVSEAAFGAQESIASDKYAHTGGLFGGGGFLGLGI